MVKKSLLKRASYIGVAIILALAMVPIVPGGKAFAEPVYGCAYTVHRSNGQADSRALSYRLQQYGEASLCDNMSDGRGLSITNNAKIDLDIYTLSTNLTANNVNVTISGNGAVNGQLNVRGRGSFTITGGTYSSNPSAYVPDGYVVVANANNTYTVKARPEITVNDVVAPASISVRETETYDLTNEIALAEGVEGELTGVSLESANSGTASVAGNIVSGIASGNTEITATVSVTSYGVTTRIQKTIAVEVMPLFSDFVLNEETDGVIKIKEGEGTTLSIKSAEKVDSLSNVRISSVRLVGNSTLVRVRNGRISVGARSGVGTAKVEVVATYTRGRETYTLTRQLDVVVESALTSVAVREMYGNTEYNTTNGIELETGNSRDLRIVIEDSNNAAVTYAVESDNTDVAEVNMRGNGTSFRVSAKAIGTANVTVTVTPRNAVNGEGAKQVTFAVKVTPVLESISAEDIEIDQGETGQIFAVANDGLMPEYLYMENALPGRGILNINNDGSFTARDGRYGETTVRVSVRQNMFVSTTVNVKVNPVLSEITLAEDEITVYEGDTAEIEVTGVVNEAIRDDVTFSYSGYDHSIIGMGGTNKITPRRDGTTTVTVTGTYVSPRGNTYTASATVNVIVKSRLESITVNDINVKVGEKAGFEIAVEADEVIPRYTYEYGDNTIARNSRTGGVRALKAGDTEVTVTASHFGKTVTATAMVHVYEMETPEHHHYYGTTGQMFEVHVGDKNANARIETSVDAPWGIFVMGDNVMAFRPGVYTVTYTDYMADGTVVGEFTAEYTIFSIERETVVVERGKTIELDGHSEWSTSSAKDETTGHHIHVNHDGKVVFATDEETALGVHNVTMKHVFRYDAREVVKEVTVVVYDVTADPESDPEGVTADTLKEYIEGMFEGASSMDEWMEKMEDMREKFGNGFEAIWSMMVVNGAVMNGEEITTRVEVTELEVENVDAELVSAVEALGVDGVEYYDVSVWMARNGYDFGRLHQLNNKITVALAEVTDPESGYTRQYIVVRQHDGEEPEVLVEGVDFYIEDGILYAISDKFSTFAVTYQDTMVPAYGGVTVDNVKYSVSAPETGENTAKAESASSNTVAVIMATIMVLTACGAVVIAKRK